MAFTGGCQCGRIRYRATGPRDRASLCFCRMCQRASGGPFMAFVRFPADAVTWTTRPAIFASSNRVDRGFCANCGTPLSYQWVGGRWISLTAGSLDDAAPSPDCVFAADDGPSWIATLERLPRKHMDVAAEPGFVSHQRTEPPAP